VDASIWRFANAYGVLLLRIALGVVFFWFGALKVVGRSPVEGLVEATVYWLPAEFFVPFLGIWEMAVGIGLLFGFALRLTLALFFFQMAGTFLVLLVRPDIAFQDGNPLLLTTEGEFIVKNLVLVTAGVAVAGTARPPKHAGRVIRSSSSEVAERR
jgi:uncharacterized membrane protein YkgB